LTIFPLKYLWAFRGTHFEQNFTTGSIGIGIGRAWCSRKACEIFGSLIQKKNGKKIMFLHTSCPNNNRPVFEKSNNNQLVFWSQGILEVKNQQTLKIPMSVVNKIL
jgi:hypothetical protein